MLVLLSWMQAAIRKELNEFKSAEMAVHEESRHLTRCVAPYIYNNHLCYIHISRCPELKVAEHPLNHVVYSLLFCSILQISSALIQSRSQEALPRSKWGGESCDFLACKSVHLWLHRTALKRLQFVLMGSRLVAWTGVVPANHAVYWQDTLELAYVTIVTHQAKGSSGDSPHRLEGGKLPLIQLLANLLRAHTIVVSVLETETWGFVAMLKLLKYNDQKVLLGYTHYVSYIPLNWENFWSALNICTNSSVLKLGK